MNRCECGLLAGKFFVEITCVGAAVLWVVASAEWHVSQGCTHNRREVWRRNSFMENVIKVNIFEERVSFYFLGVGFPGTQPT
jgi:hypothetical protein